MKVPASGADRFAAAPPADLRAALVFGPDQGLVRERAEALAKSVVGDLADPFRVSELDDAVLAADPARLWDEAAAIAMLGGRRVVRVRGAGNTQTRTFERFLADPAGDALVVVEAGDLARGSSLRKLFENAETAAAIACYADTPREVEEVVRAAMRAAGLEIAPDALAEAVQRLGSDRGTTRRELEKLVLYAAGSKSVSRDDVVAAMGDESEARIEEACDAAGEGHLARLDLALERLWTADVSPVAVLRVAMGHFQRLLAVSGETASGVRAEDALRRLRPPVHFRRADSFRAQLRRWTPDLVLEALDHLLEAEALCKTTGVPARAAAARGLFTVAALARSR